MLQVNENFGGLEGNCERLWAAAWGIWGGGVIAVSSDGGRTWDRRDNELEDFSVRAIAATVGLVGYAVSTEDGPELRGWLAARLTPVISPLTRGPDGGESYDDGATAKLGPSSLRHHEDGAHCGADQHRSDGLARHPQLRPQPRIGEPHRAWPGTARSGMWWTEMRCLKTQ